MTAQYDGRNVTIYDFDHRRNEVLVQEEGSRLKEWVEMDFIEIANK